MSRFQRAERKQVDVFLFNVFNLCSVLWSVIKCECVYTSAVGCVDPIKYSCVWCVWEDEY